MRHHLAAHRREYLLMVANSNNNVLLVLRRSNGHNRECSQVVEMHLNSLPLTEVLQPEIPVLPSADLPPADLVEVFHHHLHHREVAEEARLHAGADVKKSDN
jgi:hypothetical protein